MQIEKAVYKSMFKGQDGSDRPGPKSPKRPDDTQPKRSGSRRFKILTLLQLCTVVAIVAGGWFYIRPQKSVSAPQRGIIEGILFSPDSPSVLIDGQVLRVGDSLYGVEVVAIEQRIVTFQRNGRKWEQRVNQGPNKGWNEPDSSDQ